MRQLLLRVSDELHERLTRRAAAEGKSVNTLATGALDVLVASEPTTPRDIVRARAQARGMLRPTPRSEPPNTADLARAYAALARLAPALTDEIIDEQRGGR